MKIKLKYKRKCPVCNTEFETTRGNKIFCSYPCAKKGCRPNVEPHFCMMCGDPIPNNHKFCIECKEIHEEKARIYYWGAKYPVFSAQCKLCGKTFLTKSKNHKFCSDECAHQSMLNDRKTNEKIKVYEKNYRAAPERKKRESELARKRYHKDIEKTRAKRREYSSKPDVRERINQLARNWRKLHAETVKTNNKKYREENVSKLCSYDRSRYYTGEIRICKDCNSPFKVHRAAAQNTCCKTCNIRKRMDALRSLDGVSSAENKIFELFPNFTEQNYRPVWMRGQELDLFDPKRNFAIEFNGCYWHSELKKARGYHQKKQDLCELHGVKLLQIWDIDWENREKLICSHIKRILGKLTRVPATTLKTEISTTLSKEYRLFMESNHISGTADSLFCVGLRNSLGQLQGVCQFGINKDKEGQWEIQRYVTRMDISIDRGLEKCLAVFHKAVPHVLEIFCTVDRMWDGAWNEFAHYGFELFDKLPSSYSYSNFKKKKALQKKELFRREYLLKKHPEFSPDMTELEMAHELGYYRLYDAGKLVYRLKFKKNARSG